jgi:predicted nucleotidyltransferase
MSSISASQLRELTSAIVREIDPVRVVLLGSQARGTAGEDSDVDLLVIDDRPFSAQRSRRRAIARLRHSLPRVGVPIDVLLFHTQEVERWGSTTNHLVADALREGVVLYERH